MKIGLVLDDSLDRNDGVQQYVRSLGAWLVSKGHVVHYLAGQSTGDNLTVHSLTRNVAVRFNQNRLTIPLPANSKSIKKLLDNEKYDILHVQMPYSPFLAGKIIVNAPLTTGVVGTFHVIPFGNLQKHGSKILGLVQKRTLSRFDAICSVSTAAQQFAHDKFDINTVIIPNMINLKHWKTNAKCKPGRIVFLGRLVPRKGCAEFLAALRMMPEDIRQKIEIIIAGDGPQRAKLEAYVRTNKIPNVQFLGYIHETEKKELLASAELAVFPSLGGESFGIVLIEAMAAGAGVVIGGDNIGYRCVLSQWPEALVAPTDTLNFARLMQEFISNESLRSRIHREQSHAVKDYDTDVVGAKVLDLYKAAMLRRT